MLIFRRYFVFPFLLTAFFACASPAQQNPADPYSVVHGSPVLPDGLVLGQVSGVAVDSHNHGFVFHRAENSWATDNAWVTDRALQQVFKFSHDGKLLLTIGTERVSGVDATHFDKPTDIAFASDGSIYVSDGYGNNRVAKFSSDGKFLFDWGHKGQGPGEFDLPHSVAVDAQGNVYVADRSNARIQVFDSNGKFLKAWKSPELGRPWSLTFGPDNLLYVVDGGDLKPAPPDRGQILKLDLSGKILAKWSRFGNYDGQIYWGHDLAVGKDAAVYVGDVYHGMRVQKFVPR